MNNEAITLFDINALVLIAIFMKYRSIFVHSLRLTYISCSDDIMPSSSESEKSLNHIKCQTFILSSSSINIIMFLYLFIISDKSVDRIALWPHDWIDIHLLYKSFQYVHSISFVTIHWHCRSFPVLWVLIHTKSFASIYHHRACERCQTQASASERWEAKKKKQSKECWRRKRAEKIDEERNVKTENEIIYDPKCARIYPTESNASIRSTRTLISNRKKFKALTFSPSLSMLSFEWWTRRQLLLTMWLERTYHSHTHTHTHTCLWKQQKWKKKKTKYPTDLMVWSFYVCNALQ